MVVAIDVGRDHVRRRTYAALRSAARLVMASVAGLSDDGRPIRRWRWRE
jgi:hypothetical protein